LEASTVNQTLRPTRYGILVREADLGAASHAAVGAHRPRPGLIMAFMSPMRRQLIGRSVMRKGRAA